jgi:predicted nucleic acid-binding protein
VIAVDTNVIASLVLPTSGTTEAAMEALERDRAWVAPVLWRSEFGNVLATGVRNGWFSLDEALEAWFTAEELMEGGEYSVPVVEAIKLAAGTGCSSYDCEFVVLARDLQVQLVTLDRELLAKFEGLAVSLEDFTATPP